MGQTKMKSSANQEQAKKLILKLLTILADLHVLLQNYKIKTSKIIQQFLLSTIFFISMKWETKFLADTIQSMMK